MTVKKKVRPLVVVSWNDAWSGASWSDASRAQNECNPAKIFSVGWLMNKNKEGVFLAARFDGPNDNIGNYSFIPHACITRIETIKGQSLVSP